jgi:hypothetical protein
MRRKALLIAHPGNGEERLLGVYEDLKRYQRFLRSPIGGWWDDEEIVVLEEPDAKEVLSAIRSISDADYSLVMFSGHGRKPGTSTLISLGDDELAAPRLYTARRQTVILDCCRYAPPPTLIVEELAKSIAKAKAFLDPARCRYLYEKRIRESAGGRVLMYACSPGGFAYVLDGDPNAGGVYAQTLIDVAVNWAKQKRHERLRHVILSVVGAHGLAKQQVEIESEGDQEPSIRFPKASPHYPFCVVA